MNEMRGFILILLQLVFTSLIAKDADKIRIETILKSDWGAYLHTPPYSGPLPVIITLGGAEGGLSFEREEADALASEGYIVMRMGYFKYTKATQKQTLCEIRIEKVFEAIEWVKQQPAADSTKIALMGVSKGAELALLVASLNSSVMAVAAHVPSHVVWFGIGRWTGLKRSSWSFAGRPVPFVPYGKPKSGWFTKRIAEFYEAGIMQHPKIVELALIPVEKIKGHIYLSSGGKDNIWPSTYMATAIENRLRSNNFIFTVKHVHFPEAGHSIIGRLPEKNNLRAMKALETGGGCASSNYEARQNNWLAMLSFFKQAFEQNSKCAIR